METLQHLTSSNQFSKPVWNPFSWLSGSYSAQLQNYYNNLQAEKAYQREVQMWNLQNEYNSPVSQMQRYQQAGLNTNLIYGSGASAGNASSHPSYNAPNMSSVPTGLETFQRVASLVGTLIGLKGQLAQASVAEQKAQNYLLINKWYPTLQGYKVNQYKSNYWSSLDKSPLAYFKLVENSDDPWKESASTLLSRHPGLMLSSGFRNALNAEYTLPYQGELKKNAILQQAEQIARLRNINSLLKKQESFYNMDKWIDYGTHVLGSLLNLGRFGLSMKNYQLPHGKYY